MWQTKTFQPWKVLFARTCCPDTNPRRWLTLSLSQTNPLEDLFSSHTCAVICTCDAKAPPGPYDRPTPAQGPFDLWPQAKTGICKFSLFISQACLLTHSKSFETARLAFFSFAFSLRPSWELQDLRSRLYTFALTPKTDPRSFIRAVTHIIMIS